METNQQDYLDERIIRVTDILQQIDELNKMIDFHRKNSNNSSMFDQYQYMKNEFQQELWSILTQYKITNLIA